MGDLWWILAFFSAGHSPELRAGHARNMMILKEFNHLLGTR